MLRYFAGPQGLRPGDAVPLELGPIPYDRAARVFRDVDQARRQALILCPDGATVYEVEAHSGEVRGAGEVLWAYVTGATVRAALHDVSIEQASGGEIVAEEAPRIGFRTWCFCGAPMVGLLTVHDWGGYEFPMWQPGVNRIGCIAGHQTPAAECGCPNTCGLIAYDSLEATRGRDSNPDLLDTTYPIAAVVKTWGRHMRGGMNSVHAARGWRAEYGELLALAIVPPLSAADVERAAWVADPMAARFKIPRLASSAELVDFAEQVRRRLP